MTDLKKMLGNHPTVSNFNRLLAHYPPEEKINLYHDACYLTLHEWNSHPVKYKRFFVNLVKHDRQAYLDYIHQHTILGELRYPLDDPGMFKKMCHLVERKSTNHKVSYNHFAFSLLMVFDFNLKVRVLSNQISQSSFYPEELLELLQYAHILK